jgi:hypothetical protein
MGWACNTDGEDEKYTFLSEHLKGKHNLGEVVVDRKKILKWILKK